MANSAPPVQDYMLQLATGRLTPEKFALLQYKLATGSRAAIKIMHAIKPGEWECAVGDTREFNDIRCRLEAALHAWIHSNPTSKGFVWPLPAPIQEPTPTPSTNTANDTDAKFAQLDAHIAAFTRPDPIVRKKPTIVFVTDRRQPTPAPADDQGQQTGTDKTPAMPPSISTAALSESERRLARLRGFGGSIKYYACEWKVKGIKYLVKIEKSESKKRSDIKTIRKDLVEAAQAERDAKAASPFKGLIQQ